MRTLLPVAIVVALLLAAARPSSQSPWAPQRSPSAERLRAIAAVSEKVAWASGNHGTVLKTTDGGAVWAAVGIPDAASLDFRDVEAFDDRTAFVLSIGEGERSRIYKTTDGGRTWRKVLYVDERTGAADVAVDPQRPNRVFASTWQFRRWPWSFTSGGPGSGLWSSVDRGETWKRLQPEDGLPEGELGRIGIAIARSNPDVVYALVEAGKSALLRSDDGGRTFKTVNREPGIDPRPFYFGAKPNTSPKRSKRIRSASARGSSAWWPSTASRCW